ERLAADRCCHRQSASGACSLLVRRDHGLALRLRVGSLLAADLRRSRPCPLAVLGGAETVPDADLVVRIDRHLSGSEPDHGSTILAGETGRRGCRSLVLATALCRLLCGCRACD